MPVMPVPQTLDLLTDHFVFPDIFEIHRRQVPDAVLIVVPYDGSETSPGYLRVSADGTVDYRDETFTRTKSVLGARPLKAHQTEWRDVDRIQDASQLMAVITGELRLLEQVTR